MKTPSLFILLVLGFLDPAVHAADAPITPYPLKVCLVTGNDLGSMGDEKRIVYESREIKFCCAPCERKFRKDPAKYLPRLETPPAK